MSVYEHAECTYSPRRASSLSVGGKASLTLPLLALVLNLTAVAAILVSQASHFSLTCFSVQGTPLSLKQGERKSDRQREGWGEWTLFTLVRVNSIGLPEHTLTIGEWEDVHGRQEREMKLEHTTVQKRWADLRVPGS